MKIAFSRFKVVPFCVILLLSLPLQAWAQLRIVACFEERDPQTIVGNDQLNNFLKLKGCIDIDSVSYSAENPVTLGSATNGAGAGKVSFNDIKITHKIDTTSPSFFLNMASGRHYKSISILYINVTNQATYAQASLSLQLGLAFTTKIESSASSGDAGVPSEILSFAYGAMKMQALSFDPVTQKPLKPAISIWNRITNTNQLDAQTVVPNLDLVAISNQPIK